MYKKSLKMLENLLERPEMENLNLMNSWGARLGERNRIFLLFSMHVITIDIALQLISTHTCANLCVFSVYLIWECLESIALVQL